MIPTAKIKKVVEKILEKSNISSAPVEVENLAKEVGIEIIKAELPHDISGAIDMENPSRPRILINKDHPLVRQRFSIAHELGHFFLHKPDGIHIDKNFSSIFLRNEDSSTALYPIEIEANKFAALLLMPEKFLVNSIRQKLQEERTIEISTLIKNLKDQFEVSEPAMKFRLQNLGIINE